MELRNGLFFFSRLPRSRLGGLVFAMLTCFLLVGMVASTCGGIRGFSRSLASTGGFSPFPVPWVSVYWSPGISLLGLLPPSCSGCGSSAAPPVLHTLRQPGFPRTPASWVLTVASAPDSERAFAFGRSLCSVSSSASSPSTLVASWCGG